MESFEFQQLVLTEKKKNGLKKKNDWKNLLTSTETYCRETIATGPMNDDALEVLKKVNVAYAFLELLMAMNLMLMTHLQRKSKQNNCNQ